MRAMFYGTETLSSLARGRYTIIKISCTARVGGWIRGYSHENIKTTLALCKDRFAEIFIFKHCFFILLHK